MFSVQGGARCEGCKPRSESEMQVGGWGCLGWEGNFRGRSGMWFVVVRAPSFPPVRKERVRMGHPAEYEWGTRVWMGHPSWKRINTNYRRIGRRKANKSQINDVAKTIQNSSMFAPYNLVTPCNRSVIPDDEGAMNRSKNAINTKTRNTRSLGLFRLVTGLSFSCTAGP
jgi:hypothetical protein